jgi:hypothetical protein
MWRTLKMSIKKTFIAALAMAIAVAFSPIPELQAATFNPGSQGGGSSLVQTVKAKKKVYRKSAKRSRGKRRRAGRKGKSCGTFMYRKGGKCLDARNKK